VFTFFIAQKQKTFTFNYDSSKYILNDISKEYELILFVDKNQGEDMIEIKYYYDDLGSYEKMGSDSNSVSGEKVKLNKYDAWLHTTVNPRDIEYINYTIKVDKNTKLTITYPKSAETKVDINDFLNFSYE
jgi:hypothetical protein